MRPWKCLQLDIDAKKPAWRETFGLTVVNARDLSSIPAFSSKLMFLCLPLPVRDLKGKPEGYARDIPHTTSDRFGRSCLTLAVLSSGVHSFTSTAPSPPCVSDYSVFKPFSFETHSPLEGVPSFTRTPPYTSNLKVRVMVKRPIDDFLITHPLFQSPQHCATAPFPSESHRPSHRYTRFTEIDDHHDPSCPHRQSNLPLPAIATP